MMAAPPSRMNWPDTRFEAFLDHWRDLKGEKNVPEWRDWSPAALVPLLANINAMSVVDGGEDFIFRVYGTMHADNLELELTGRSVRDMPDRRRSERSLRLYRRVFSASAPHATFYRIEATDKVALNYSRDHVYLLRLVVPFTTGAGNVDRLLGYGEPVTEDMLDSYFGGSRPEEDSVVAVQ